MSLGYWLSQGFSALAIALGVGAYVERREARLKSMLSGAAACQAIHFLLLGATQGVVQASLTSIRFLVSTRQNPKKFFWIFLSLGVAFGVWQYKTPVDILPVLASAMACVAVFRSRGIVMRYWLLAVTLCWFSYNAWNMSIVGCLLELTYASMNLLAMRRDQGRHEAA